MNKASNLRLRHPQAAVVERGRHHLKMFDPAANVHILDVSMGSLHFGADNAEIETAWSSWVPGGTHAAYRRRMVSAEYHAYAGLDDSIKFNAGQIVKYVHPATGAEIAFQPQALQWTNDANQIQSIGSVEAVPAEIIDNALRWTNAYGAGIHFEWRCLPDKLVKLLTIDSLLSLTAPNATVLTGINPCLRMQFILAKSAGVEIFANGAAFSEGRNNSVETSGEIEFRSGGQTLWVFAPARAWDNGKRQTTPPVVVQRIRKQGASLFVEIRVPWLWLATATYPVTIDPTIDVNVSAGANDTSVKMGTSGFDSTNDNDPLGYTDIAGFGEMRSSYRFTGISGLSGATINASYMTLDTNDKNGVPLLKIRAEDAAAPSAPTSFANFTGRTLTTAGVDWDDPAAAANTNTPSLNSVIQELADSFNPTVIQIFILNDGGTGDAFLYTYMFESTIGTEARLHIEYTAGGASILKQVMAQEGA